jgi:hypothetical protein
MNAEKQIIFQMFVETQPTNLFKTNRKVQLNKQVAPIVDVKDMKPTKHAQLKVNTANAVINPVISQMYADLIKLTIEKILKYKYV